MNYAEWEKNVPDTITDDALWNTRVYRLALFLAHIGWYDVTKLSKDNRTFRLSDQLYRALGSIGANISEGYSRRSRKDQARFYEYALGSARESRHWYVTTEHRLGKSVVNHRLQLLARIIQLLLVTISEKRKKRLKEEPSVYHPKIQHPAPKNLLDDIPMPSTNVDA